MSASMMASLSAEYAWSRKLTLVLIGCKASVRAAGGRGAAGRRRWGLMAFVDSSMPAAMDSSASAATRERRRGAGARPGHPATGPPPCRGPTFRAGDPLPETRLTFADILHT